MRVKRSKTKGVTLAELLIAVAILAIVVAPVMGMFVWSAHASINAFKISIASVVAEMRMEELVGTEIHAGVAEFTDKGFIVNIIVNDLEFAHLNDDLKAALDELINKETMVSSYNGFLKMVTVTVSDDDRSVLCTQSNIINTATHGFVKKTPIID